MSAVLMAGTAGAAVHFLSVDASLSAVQTVKRSPASLSSGGSALQLKASNLLTSESRIAMEKIKTQDEQRVVLESVNFSRGNGIVMGKGSFWDGKGPRPITMFLDAYGEGVEPIASFPVQFNSNGQRQPVSASIRDIPDFERFAFRFVSNGSELRLSSPGEQELAINSISPEAMLFHSDYGELRDLLERQNYIEGKSFEPAAMLSAVDRFRFDHGLEGPSFITIGDLFALRVVSGVSEGKTDVLPYVEWASSISGGRELVRRSVSQVKPAPQKEAPVEKPSEEAFFLDEQ